MSRHAVVATTIPRTADAFYREKLAELRSRGYVVHLVASPGPEVESLRERVDEVRIVPMDREISLRADLRALQAWVRLLREIRPDLVFAGTPKAGLLAMTSGWLCRVPRRVYFLQGLRLEGSLGSKRHLLAALERLSSWCSHTVIAVSPSLAQEFRRLKLNSRREVVVAHHGSSHGVDTDHYTPQRRKTALLTELGLDPAVATVLFIGRLTRDKGPETLTAALNHLHRRGHHVQLLVVGAQDEPDSREFVRDFGRSSQTFRVIDHVDDVRPYLATCDVLVLPTLREGLPNVVLEAAAMELPTITTTSTGAIDSVVSGQTGILFDYGDWRRLADAIHYLISQPDVSRAMGVAARARVVRDFQPTDVSRSIIDIAVGVADHKPTPTIIE